VRVRQFLVFAAAGLTATCAAAPTLPTQSSGNRIVISDPVGQLASVRVDLTTILNGTLARASEALPLSGVTITVTPDPARAIGGYGVGGFTAGGATISLYLDPGFAGLATVLEARVSQTLAHEWHHAARFRGPGYGRTLLEAMVSEGMADHFAVDLLGADVPPWSRALPTPEIAKWLAEAGPQFDSPNYGHEQWFFGSTPAVPRWTGYTLGYYLVERHRKANPGATAITLVNTPASAFRP